MLRRVVWLILILTLCIFAGRMATGLAPGGYSCLKFKIYPSKGYAEHYIDVDSGRHIERTLNYPSLATINDRTLFPVALSPDAKWVVYAESYSTSVAGPITSLFMRSINGATLSSPRLIKADIPTTADGVDVSWSPDSKYFFYQWKDRKRNVSFEIISPDGKTRTSKPGNVILRYGWSADGAYLATTSSEESGFIQFWSSAEGRFLEPSETGRVFPNNPDVPNIAFLQWSPQGHTFIYIDRDANGNAQVLLFTPGEKSIPTFDTQDKLESPYFVWSPDNGYLAILNKVHVLWQLSVFGKNGTMLRHVSDKIVDDWRSFPNLSWRRDGKSLLFIVEDGDPETGQLEKLDIETNHVETLAKGLNKISPINQTEHYALVVWQQDGHEVSGMVSFEDGSRRQPVDVADARWLSPDEKYQVILPASSANPQLLLQTTDGSREYKVPVKVWGGGALVWAPDSSKFVTAEERVSATTIEITVYSTTGQRLYQTTVNGNILPELNWRRCSEI